MPPGDSTPAGASPPPGPEPATGTAHGQAPLRRRLLADITPLRKFRQFRILWAGYLVSILGSQLTVVAVPYQVFRLTHSSLAVGLLSLAQLGPLLLASLVGGALVDAVDRRKLLLVTELVSASTSVGLGINSLDGHPVLWPLFALTAVAAATSSLDSSARSAVQATIVGPESY